MLDQKATQTKHGKDFPLYIVYEIIKQKHSVSDLIRYHHSQHLLPAQHHLRQSSVVATEARNHELRKMQLWQDQ